MRQILRKTRFRASLAITTAALAVVSTAAAAAPPASGAPAAFPRLQSLYVRMPDGVRLAVNVWLPPGTTASSRLPTVLETDRYWRSPAYSGGYQRNPEYPIAEPWMTRGYAYVFADLRGTGASFGTNVAELGRALVADSGSLGDWIAARPWSNGRVGVTGLNGASHGALYAYLEDVQPSGRVVYVTEGELSLVDRAVAPKRENPPWAMLRTPRTFDRADASPFPIGPAQQVTFDLLPTSVLFHAGDRIRITIAAADPDAFQLLPSSGKASYEIGHGGTAPSYLDLPVTG